MIAHPEEEPGYRSAQGRIVKTMLDRHDFKAAVDLHQMTRGGDVGQVHIRRQGLAGYDPSQLHYAHEVATHIEEDWRAKGFGMEQRSLIEGEGWPPNITDFIHLYGRGHPAAFMVEVTKGPGTTKQMQKKIALSAVETVIEHVLTTDR